MSEFFAVSQLVNKNHSSTFHGIMFLFHTYWQRFFHISIQRLETKNYPWKYTVGPIRDMNDVTSQYKS